MMSPYDAGLLLVFKARRRAHSWDYVTEAATTLKTGQKTVEMGILYASKSLIITKTGVGLARGYNLRIPYA